LKSVIQRVSEAGVSVDGREVSRIGRGMLALVGVEKGDTAENAAALAKKISEMRIFEDAAGKMNLSVLETGGEVLAVSQFTLCADTCKGRRPGFDPAAPPALAEELFRKFTEALRARGVAVSEGVFGAHMRVALVNDGPVTFTVET
jgi:D-tyrosyl-tRNA(Tyr) deacylase